LAQGLWVVIFPEGTRMRPHQQGKYHIGGAWLACQTKSPVLPVAHNAGHCWPKGFIKQAGVIKLHIGPAIATADLKADALNLKVEQWIEAQMQVINAA
jgi:1-acyl-sn-glycerol-3-phosphate acyltransferase